MLSVLSFGAWADNPTSWNNPYLPSAKSGQQYAIRYTSDEMSHDANSSWMKVGYDDSGWTLGAGPIGHNGLSVPSGTAALGSSFDIYDKSQSYYLRREFTLDRDLTGKNIYMTCGHDDEGAIWIDGTQIISWGNTWSDTYVHTMTSEQTALLTKGKHVIAIWAKNNSGGYYWDCGLYGDDLSTNLDWGKDTSWKATYKYAGSTDAADPANDAAGYGWTKTIYNDADWSTMAMPCGSSWPQDNKGTKWEGENNRYWFRRPFLLTSIDKTKTYTLQFVHDDDYEIYINGKLLQSETGWRDNYSDPKYCIVPAEDLNVGENVIAARVTQFTGGSLFDCRLVLSDKPTVTFTPKAGNYNSNTYENLFDGSTNTKWEAAADSYPCNFSDNYGNVVFEASQAIYVNGITLYTADDTEGQWQRNPVEWSLYGSNDDGAISDATGGTFTHSSWVEIAHINNAQMPAANKTAKHFMFNPSQSSYKYFKFHVNKHVERWQDVVQLSRLVLDYTTSPESPITLIANGGGYNNEGAGNLFDGPSKTKWCKSNSASTNWVVFKTPHPTYYVSNYAIQTAANSGEQNRDPKKFKLYGALASAPTTDGSTTGWTVIDSEDDASGTIPTDPSSLVNFTIDDPGIYQYFMLKVEEIRGSDGSFQLSELVFPAQDFYYINDAKDLSNFAKRVNGGDTKIIAVVTNDIVAEGNFTSIGTTSNKFGGIFDGQGHTITINVGSSSEFQGLIGCADNGAYIKNVIVKGSIAGPSRCGGVLGGSSGASGTITLLNCGNEASVTVAGQNAGGVVGCNSGGSAVYNLTNCYNSGTIKGGSESAGIAGWLGSNAVVTNCYNIGDVTGVDGTKTFARWGSGTYVNCYNKLAANEFAGRTDSYPMDKVRSGELCVALGSAFAQDLSQTSHPTFGSKTVTAGQWFSDANDVYYNLEGGNYTVYQLNLNEENTKYAVPDDGTVTATNVSVARNIPAGQWIGLCLPFDYDIPSGWEVREMTAVNGSGESASMVFSAVSTTIEAGKPYIVKPTSAVETPITAVNKTIAASTTDVSFSGVTMKGRLKKDMIHAGDFYINTLSQLKKLTATSATLKGFRAYFTVDSGSGVKALGFDFDDDATAIEMVNGQSSMVNGPVYNLAGQRLNKMQKGINIINGKKILK